MISAVGIFFLGCGVTVVHGIHTIQDALAGNAHAVENLTVAWVVLVLAFVVEGWSLWVAFKAVKAAAAEQNWTLMDYVRKGPDPMGVAVLFEDSAAVIGVVIAGAAMGMAHWTGNAIWDGAGSIAIGLLMGVLAIFLIQKNRTFLIGKAVDVSVSDRLEKVLESDPVVEEVDQMRATVTGAASAEIAPRSTLTAKSWPGEPWQKKTWTAPGRRSTIPSSCGPTWWCSVNASPSKWPWKSTDWKTASRMRFPV